jgi:hypothetical protein
VRRVLASAGVESHPSSADGGRAWALRIGPVPAEQVGELIDSCIWPGGTLAVTRDGPGCR